MVTHPVALRDGNGQPGAYTHGTTTYRIDSEGVIQCPAGVEDDVAAALADHYDVDADDLLGDAESTETCDVVKSDGEVCGRELPCPYHSDDSEEE